MYVRSYEGTLNLGDAIQTYALCRLLPQTLAWPGEDKADPGRPLVVNGWLGREPIYPATALYAGVFVSSWLPAHWDRVTAATQRPVGARDPATATSLAKLGTSASVIGCATLTLPRYDGPRSGILHFDDYSPGCLSNGCDSDVPWPRQWELAVARLDQLRRAALVYTHKLHVALPCLALGTPMVWQVDGDEGDRRFSVLDAMGIPPCEEVGPVDVSEWANRYRDYLGGMLGISLVERSPELPV